MSEYLTIAIHDVIPNPDNPRLIKDDKFEKLRNSIQQSPSFMILNPLKLNEDLMILGGNMRHKACIDLGWKRVPYEVFTQKHAEENNKARRKAKKENPKLEIEEATYLEQCQEFVIKDNIGYGENDWDKLANEWEFQKLEEWGMDIPDFARKEEDAEEDNYIIPDKIETDILPGDVIHIGPHRVLCGDATSLDDWAKIMGDERADLVVTDPPYNVDYVGKTKDALKIENDKMGDDTFYNFLFDFYSAAGEFTKAGGAWYVWHADSEGANFRKAMVDAGISLRQCLIWQKNHMVMGRQDYHWQHEPCLYGWKEGAAHAWYTDRKQTTLLQFDRPQRNAEHPTMKPVPLIAYQITNSSKAGDLIADGFLGSGTTILAADQLGRKCYGLELDPTYCQVIIDRMLEYNPAIEVKINGKDYIPAEVVTN